MHTVTALRAATAAWRTTHPNQHVALVPTMGALHEGHLRLIDHALAHADAVIVSIFVNPTQFAPGEDFERYPRTLAADRDACAGRGVHWIFAPNAREMYPEDDQTEVVVPGLAEGLCGVSRPHFFGGVARVVLKLLNIAQADIAVFGEKDYQQLQVIRRMVRDLHHPTRILAAETVREPDGLAMSSRNRNLSTDERRQAPELHRALQTLAAQLQGESDAAAVERAVQVARAHIGKAGGRVDYLSVVDAEDLAIATDDQRARRVAAAVWFGETRLIDNLPVFPGLSRAQA